MHSTLVKKACKQHYTIIKQQGVGLEKLITQREVKHYRYITQRAQTHIRPNYSDNAQNGLAGNRTQDLPIRRPVL